MNKRHALFVGVNTYDDKSITDLKYSVPDASVLADRFRGLGYKVRSLTDPTGAELKSAVVESVEGLGLGDVFLFFFAGHGFTTQDGAHLLFCRDDIQKLLRVNGAGTRVDVLEALTNDGGFHRAFLLDSCRTDCFAGMEHRGGCATRDLDFIAMPKCTSTSGSFYLLRSCDKFRPSLEFDAIGHGLFTQGLIDAMDAHDHRLAECDTSFATAVAARMEIIQRNYQVDNLQRPSVGECSGPVFSLFDSGYCASEAFSGAQGIQANRQSIDDARYVEEQRRMAAIKEKEAQLESEARRLREEKQRQDILLAEKQSRIEEEKRREEERLNKERERMAQEMRDQEKTHGKQGYRVDYYRRRKMREWTRAAISALVVFAIVLILGIIVYKLSVV